MIKLLIEIFMLLTIFTSCNLHYDNSKTAEFLMFLETLKGKKAVDNTAAPTAGTAISFSSVGAAGLTITWGAATDKVTAQASLEYKVVKDNAATANIDTIAEADAKTGGDLLQDWTANITNKAVTGLSASTTYHFAVLVRNAAGNNTLYSPASQVTPISCPTNYIAVPFNTAVGTMADFCVAKYEMKNVGGVATSQAALTPWVNINQTNAKTQCTNLGSGYHLITNPEWMTIARNIETTASNWSTGTVNSGAISNGHSDNAPGNALAASTDNNGCFGTGQACSDVTWNSQRRTHTLSNAGVI